MPYTTLAFIGNLGPWEIIVILVIALLVFGKRLPEVGKSLGKGIVEFKKGLHGVEDEIEAAGSQSDPPRQIEDQPANTVDTATNEHATADESTKNA